MNSESRLWKKDAKWVAGIYLTIFLSLFLLFSTISKLITVENFDKVVNYFFLARVEEFVGERFDEIKYFASLYPDEKIPLLKEFPVEIEITGNELKNKSSADISRLLIKNISVEIFKNRLDMKKIKNFPELYSKIDGLEFFFFVFSEKGKSIVDKISIGLFIGSLLSFILLILFSYRFGKIVSVGVCFIISSLPGVISSKIIERILINEVGLSGAGMEVFKSLFNIHRNLFLSGIILIIIGILGGLFYGKKVKQIKIEAE